MDPISITSLIFTVTKVLQKVSKKINEYRKRYQEFTMIPQDIQRLCSTLENDLKIIRTAIEGANDDISRSPHLADPLRGCLYHITDLLNSFYSPLELLQDKVDTHLQLVGNKTKSIIKLRAAFSENKFKEPLDSLVDLQGKVQGAIYSLLLQVNFLPYVEQFFHTDRYRYRISVTLARKRGESHAIADHVSYSSDASNQGVYHLPIREGYESQSPARNTEAIILSWRVYQKVTYLDPSLDNIDPSLHKIGSCLSIQGHSPSDADASESSALCVYPKDQPCQENELRARKKAKHKKRIYRWSPTSCAQFGDLPTMAYNLSHAVLARRQFLQKIPKDFKSLYNRVLVKEVVCTTFRDRFMQMKFVECWLMEVAEAKKLHAATFPKYKLHDEQVIAELLGFAKDDKEKYDRQYWSARKLKSRYSIWLDLCKIFESELGRDSFVALCAVSATCDSMRTREKKAFLKEVQARKLQVLPHLRAAIRPFAYAVDELERLDTLEMEVRWRPDEIEDKGMFSGLTLDAFKTHFSKATG
ncbi:hypothetical protein G7Y89_g6399 [Cudoniella acicularis]|uniref:Fungal N-terminal domain-containing protein n=1 Tax=Cudoniella acicularis TaxID=354080 RepID=A0A8H4W5K0_9HELO|nr:hypothetical protein G7Y89_g6399 [Cudoniella acicularis]